ncbi:MAG: cupin domain-containing protein [Lentisphaeraceae bacterium]|nr:cupin domain-containing protein [Lentisphaeraceae bacterium]
MNTADEIIIFLDLQEHPEGGYFKETYRSEENFEVSQGTRSASTAIYFLLKEKQKSAFHRLTSDEFWYYHSGCPLEVYIIQENGELSTHTLGPDLLNKELPQLLLPKGTWFAARCIDQTNYTLISCSVSPGFHFDDFELAETDKLTESYPQHRDLIKELT